MQVLTEDRRFEILDQVGHGKLLRVGRDDLGLISRAAVFNPADGTEVQIRRDEATLLLGDDSPVYSLARLASHRTLDKLGYVDLGCPEDGSEWYAMLQ